MSWLSVGLMGNFLLSAPPDTAFISMTFGTFSLQYHIAGVSWITGMATESLGQGARDSKCFNLHTFKITIICILLKQKRVGRVQIQVKMILKIS